jgi:hypothetical protein
LATAYWKESSGGPSDLNEALPTARGCLTFD